MNADVTSTAVDALVVGAGLSGIAAGAMLKREGIDDFVIIDKAPDFGGTWRVNTYPGVACDIPSQVYSFAFAPNREWSRVFAPGGEIHRYLLDVVESQGLREHAVFGCELLTARWNDDVARWTVQTTTGTYQARFLIIGAGPLEEPRLPDIPGLESFPGRVFHSAQWPADYDPRGERVALIGTGASAVQIFPEVARDAEHITLFQRTPPWILPKPDWEHGPRMRRLIRQVPIIAPIMRRLQWAGTDIFLLSLFSVWAGRLISLLARYNIRRAINDPALRKALTPDYVVGCKRMSLSNTYYPALARPNAELVASALSEISGCTLIAANGARREVDTVIFSTGFHVADGAIYRRIFGRDGRSLTERWQGCPRAYKSVTMAGCPNAFVLLGPNGLTSSGATSVEAQLSYVAAALRTMRLREMASIEVRESEEAAWKASANRLLARSVHTRGGCVSYYLDRAGHNVFVFPSRTLRGMEKALHEFDPAAYEVTYQARPEVDATSPATQQTSTV